jgi:hypothetical protein
MFATLSSHLFLCWYGCSGIFSIDWPLADKLRPRLVYSLETSGYPRFLSTCSDTHSLGILAETQGQKYMMFIYHLGRGLISRWNVQLHTARFIVSLILTSKSVIICTDNEIQGYSLCGGLFSKIEWSPRRGQIIVYLLLLYLLQNKKCISANWPVKCPREQLISI